ncbi:DUF4335 domain-containing protein [Argonema antarcticum]|uniref:DUF4335 domain-containing protein n=1 Tax=Argonema antarcticum TaxID=2942763 RepID=UPI002010C98D|nr:DUF4335 domain-containing protein [Argonema antarcticum]MCL1474956.1 DUF4335 domain-containing protein [Argonema antarcticum A004/B2]
MYSSTSVLRRYTPPTCTLEIVAKGSPLSRWVGRTVLKRLQFVLSFDDPRVPEEKRVSVRGDQTQLEALCEVVQGYVQDFLEQSPDRLNASFLAPSPNDQSELSDTNGESTNGSGDTNAEMEMPPHHTPGSEEGSIALSSHPLDSDSTATNSPELELGEKETSANGTPFSRHEVTGIYLQPNGLLFHDLFLSSLATEQLGPVIHLSLLQLFDLATALDEYAAELEILPTLNRPALGKTPPFWASIAAIALVTVGVTTAAVKLLDRKTSNPEIPATAVNPEPNPTEQPQIAAVPLPQPTPGVPTPPLSSSQTLPALPPSASNLSPNPSVTLPPGSGLAPSPGVMPSAASTVPPSPGVTPPAASTVPPSPGVTPPAASTLPPGPSSTASKPEQYKLPLNSAPPQPGSGGPTTSPKPPDNQTEVRINPSETLQRQESTQPQTLKQPAATAPPPPKPNPTPPLQATTSPTAQRQESSDLPSTNQSAARIASAPAVVTKSRPTPEVIPPTAQSSPRITPPPAQPIPRITPPPTQEIPPIAILPTQEFPSITPPPIQELPPITPPPAQESFPVAAAPTQSADVKPPVAARSGTPAPPPTPSSSTSLFDTIPQVAEAKSYFQNRWQPPTSLKQRLEYSLALNPDGSIRQIIPLGQVAETYLDRTEMPLVGETFVSPIEGKRSPKIRVVLSPDGKVDTFLESLD